MSEVKSRGHVAINAEECKGCELCIAACPMKVLSLSEIFNTHGYHTSSYVGEGCSGCGICFYTCPEPGAITVFKRWDLMTEKRFCPSCGVERKVFSRDSAPDILLCAECGQPVNEEKNQLSEK
ncbi:MAG: ferredoxin family protein [Candidatus Neomarinimicrobiota bacterium]